MAALQALIGALKEAKGWAKVDVIDAFATINQSRFFEIMLASGLDNAEGLESYLAAPLYPTAKTRSNESTFVEYGLKCGRNTSSPGSFSQSYR